MRSDFLVTGMSAVDISSNVLIGRPYVGTAILYRKRFASDVQLMNTSDPRACSVIIETNMGPLMIASVNMSLNTGDAENYECFLDIHSVEL